MIMSQLSNQIIFVEANNLLSDSKCIFEIKDSNYRVVETARDIIDGFFMNPNLLICNIPDFKDIGSVQVELKIGYGSEPLKTQSKSSVMISFLDRCPPGYACKDFRIFRCPKGHYCIGGG